MSAPDSKAINKALNDDAADFFTLLFKYKDELKGNTIASSLFLFIDAISTATEAKYTDVKVAAIVQQCKDEAKRLKEADEERTEPPTTSEYVISRLSQGLDMLVFVYKMYKLRKQQEKEEREAKMNDFKRRVKLAFDALDRENKAKATAEAKEPTAETEGMPAEAKAAEVKSDAEAKAAEVKSDAITDAEVERLFGFRPSNEGKGDRKDDKDEAVTKAVFISLAVPIARKWITGSFLEEIVRLMASELDARKPASSPPSPTTEPTGQD
ncbi:Hypothetical protein POVN_LOCUS230 [uncultured virus]|nr:Hypothetical protein POVN_LOCUS230 [uncultured virus]